MKIQFCTLRENVEAVKRLIPFANVKEINAELVCVETNVRETNTCHPLGTITLFGVEKMSHFVDVPLNLVHSFWHELE